MKPSLFLVMMVALVLPASPMWGQAMEEAAPSQEVTECADPWHDLLMVCKLQGGCSKGILVTYGMDEACQEQIQEELELDAEQLQIYFDLVIGKLVDVEQALHFELPSTCTNASRDCLDDPMRPICVPIRLCHRDIVLAERAQPDQYDDLRERIRASGNEQAVTQAIPLPVGQILAPFIFNLLLVGIGYWALRRSPPLKVVLAIVRGALFLSAGMLGIGVIALVAVNRPELEAMRQALIGLVPAFALAVMGIMWLRVEQPESEAESASQA